MTPKLIIHIETDEISDGQAMHMVACIVGKGRVSETAKRKHYCHHATWRDRSVTSTKRSDATDTFYVRWAPRLTRNRNSATEQLPSRNGMTEHHPLTLPAPGAPRFRSDFYREAIGAGF